MSVQVTTNMVATVLGAKKPERIEDDHVHGYHYSLTQAFVNHFAARSSTFMLDQFVQKAGYSLDVANDMRKVAWVALDSRRQSRLRKEHQIIGRSRRAWFWEVAS